MPRDPRHDVRGSSFATDEGGGGVSEGEESSATDPQCTNLAAHGLPQQPYYCHFINKTIPARHSKQGKSLCLFVFIRHVKKTIK